MIDAERYHAQQCYHEGCQWKEKQKDVDYYKALAEERLAEIEELKATLSALGGSA